MSLMDAGKRIEDEAKSAQRCKLGRMLDALSPEELAYYDARIAEGCTHVYIADLFTKDPERDWSLDEATVRRHRSERCQCR